MPVFAESLPRRARRPVPLAAALLLGAALVSGCVPYAVGTTAATVPAGQVTQAASVQYASERRALREGDRRVGMAYAAVSNEARLGLDAYSDVGVQLVGGLSGAVVTYKRRLAGLPAEDEGTALLVGAGVVAGARHAHFEATLVRSLPARGAVVPYGGVRAQALLPFAADAAPAAPAVGVFGGARLGWRDLAVLPELGLFYSPSELLRASDVIVVPSVTVRGDRLLRALGL